MLKSIHAYFYGPPQELLIKKNRIYLTQLTWAYT